MVDIKILFNKKKNDINSLLKDIRDVDKMINPEIFNTTLNEIIDLFKDVLYSRGGTSNHVEIEDCKTLLRKIDYANSDRQKIDILIRIYDLLEQERRFVL